MNTRQNLSPLKILPVACCVAALCACASNNAVSLAPGHKIGADSWKVEPMALKNSNDQPAAMYQIGRYYQGQNRYELAIAAYQRTLAADDGFVEARNGLGVVYSRQGQYRDAINAFQAAIKQAPKAAHIYNNLGYVYYLQGKYAESVAVLEQSTVLDPANQRALNNLGLAYAKLEKKEASAQAFSQAASATQVISNISEQARLAALQNRASQNSIPLAVSVPESIAPSFSANTIANEASVAVKLDAQLLAIPKDRGVVSPASSAHTVVAVKPHTKLVQVAPNVHEFYDPQYKVEPLVAVTPAVLVTEDKKITAKARLEVSNGNGVTGLAGKVGQYLQSQGYSALRLTNQKPFKVHITQIHYRAGYQVEAQVLKLSLPESPTLVQRSDLRADVAVRLVLGRDIATNTASFELKPQKVQLALNVF